MDGVDSDSPDSGLGSVKSPQVFYDCIERISCMIPETFDLGTISVELTCIASSSKYIILGTGCGTLFVYNKTLGRLARPLRTNSFEAVTCVHHLSLLDDYVVVGHNTGTLIAIRLPSGREGASTSLTQCIDTDSHRRSAITCVRINSDTQKVVSGDAFGTVILSTVIFETGEFYHCFLFEGPSFIAALEFSAESVIVHNGFQLVAVDMNSPGNIQTISDREERAVVLGIRCATSVVYVVEKFSLFKYSNLSMLDCTEVGASELIGETGCIVSVAWNSEATKLAVLSSSNVLIMFDLVRSQILWRAPLNDHLCCFVGDFCVDDDDSILYLTKPRGVHRVGVSTAAKFLGKADTDSPVASLLSSPKKLLSNNALRVTQKGFSFINNAINAAKDISANYEVTNLMEDALKILDVKNDPQHMQDLTKDVVNTSSRENASGASASVGFNRDVNKVPFTEENDVFVKRREKIRCKKENCMENSDVDELHDNDGQRTIDEETIFMLRKEVLGNNVLGSSPCGSGISIESPPTWSPRDSPYISGLHMKSADCTKASSTPCSSRDSPPAGNRKPPPPGGDAEVVSQSDGEEDLSKHSEPIEPTTNAEPLPHGAESVATAYEYLLLKSSSNPSSSKDQPSTSTDSGAVQHRLLLQERSRKNVVLNDQVDIWLKILLPYTAKSFTVGSQHIVLCHRRKTPRFIALDDLGSKKSIWQAAKWAADCVSMNGKGFVFVLKII
ncbi:hypothetical protein Y032_0030g2035 [Ancylostoma ceylanicum]|uniref:Uncharacterized protein n=1 Tax=Ancylostoma ceylanicum TaxID=53326 RepID=A0A016UPT6_9BILA|nr:hypothetical protein Y032_0030g2035 [Ancylostoma ceylanicum]